MEERREPPRADPRRAGRPVGLGRLGPRRAGPRLGERRPRRRSAPSSSSSRRRTKQPIVLVQPDDEAEARQRCLRRATRRYVRGTVDGWQALAQSQARARRLPGGAREGARSRDVDAFTQGFAALAVRGARPRLGRHGAPLEGSRPARRAGVVGGRSRARLARRRGLGAGRRRAAHARDADAGRRATRATSRSSSGACPRTPSRRSRSAARRAARPRPGERRPRQASPGTVESSPASR